jgi:hypothetical protein
MSFFNSKKLVPPSIKNNNFTDLSDQYANDGAHISFHSMISERKVSFKAFITAYTETFSSDYVSETVFGRIDPIHTFRQTVRNCTLSFVIPAATTSEAFENLARVDELRSYLYPSYTNTSNAITINQNPLVRIGIANLLTDAKTSNNYVDSFLGEGAYNYSVNGALAVINSVNVNFNLEGEAGVFDTGKGPGQTSGFIPKQIDVAVDFSIIHEREDMGQFDEESPENSARIYGTSVEDYNLNALPSEQTQNVDEFYKQQAADEERARAEQNAAAAQAAKDSRISQFRTALNQFSERIGQRRDDRRRERNEARLTSDESIEEQAGFEDEFNFAEEE